MRALIDACQRGKLYGERGRAMRRYLAQNNTDTLADHMRGSPVDNGL